MQGSEKTDTEESERIDSEHAIEEGKEWRRARWPDHRIERLNRVAKEH